MFDDDRIVIKFDGYEISTGPYTNRDSTRYSRLPDVTKKTWHPPQQAIPAVPPVPPTPARVERLLNRGWNSSARSVVALDVGSYFVFSVMEGMSGCILGLSGIRHYGIRDFKFSIVCDLSGVHVFNYSTKVFTLASSYSNSSFIRIHRQSDQAAVFVFTDGTDTTVYKSDLGISKWWTYYIYGLLYTGGDKILTAAFNSGDVQFGSG